MSDRDASGKLHAGVDRPFICEGDGEEFTKEEVLVDVERSIRELEAQLERAKQFKYNVLTDARPATDSYLSFRYVVEHGYEQTGPQFVSVKEES